VACIVRISLAECSLGWVRSLVYEGYWVLFVVCFPPGGGWCFVCFPLFCAGVLCTWWAVVEPGSCVFGPVGGVGRGSDRVVWWCGFCVVGVGGGGVLGWWGDTGGVRFLVVFVVVRWCAGVCLVPRGLVLELVRVLGAEAGFCFFFLMPWWFWVGVLVLLWCNISCLYRGRGLWFSSQ